MAGERVESNEEIMQRAAAHFGRVPLSIRFRVVDPQPLYAPGPEVEPPPAPEPPAVRPLDDIREKDVFVHAIGTYHVLSLPHPHSKKQYLHYAFVANRPDAWPKPGKMRLPAFQRIALESVRQNEPLPPPPPPKPAPKWRDGTAVRELRGRNINVRLTSPATANALIDRISELVQFVLEKNRLPELS